MKGHCLLRKVVHITPLADNVPTWLKKNPKAVVIVPSYRGIRVPSLVGGRGGQAGQYASERNQFAGIPCYPAENFARKAQLN